MNTDNPENKSCSNCINKDICKHRFNASFFLDDGTFTDATEIKKDDLYAFFGAKCIRHETVVDKGE